MKPPIQFRPKRWHQKGASAGTPVSAKSATPRKSVQRSTPASPAMDSPIVAGSAAAGTSATATASDSEVPAQKRAVKAAQMRRYRDKLKSSE